MKTVQVDHILLDRVQIEWPEGDAPSPGWVTGILIIPDGVLYEVSCEPDEDGATCYGYIDAEFVRARR